MYAWPSYEGPLVSASSSPIKASAYPSLLKSPAATADPKHATLAQVNGGLNCLSAVESISGPPKKIYAAPSPLLALDSPASTSSYPSLLKSAYATVSPPYNQALGTVSSLSAPSSFLHR